MRDGRSTTIIFKDDLRERQSRQRTNVPSRRLSRSWSVHSDRSNVDSALEIPIADRRLSIQVSENQALLEEVRKSRRQTDATANKDYFESLTFHTLSAARLFQQFDADFAHGLSTLAAEIRLHRDGKNVISKYSENYLKAVFFYVFGRLCSILWVGVIIFFLCWRPLSNPPSLTNLALAILVLILIALQASFSAFQDWATKRVMNSIIDLLPSEALVRRDGQLVKISATDLVAGDIIHISIGQKVPADMRLLETSGDVRFDRAILTGESDEVEGAIDATDQNFLEARNIALMGTSVTNGSAVGMVVLTGSRSVMGRIASITAAVKQKPTLIQQEITRFVRIVVGLTIILALTILLTWAGWLRVNHYSFLDVVAILNNVMGCVVAFIPEGIPIGVALTMMMVARRMKAANIVPKGLATVETLGCVNVLCSDKTGTLTQNKMMVKSFGLLDKEFTVEQMTKASQEGIMPEALAILYRGSHLCNDSFFDPASLGQPIHEREVHGNATDAAILRFAEAIMPAGNLCRKYERIYQLPFNSKNKWMMTLHKAQAGKGVALVYVKGAPDVLLPRCTAYWSGQTNDVQILDEHAKTQFSAFQDRLSKRAERVIVLYQRLYKPKSSLGTNDFKDEIDRECIQDLTIVGIYGIIDPPRPDTASTVAACRRAGVRFFMVPGDFGLTAAAIARDVGIFTGTADPDTALDLQHQFESSQSGKKWPERSRKSLLVEGPQISSFRDADWDIICAYEEIVFARTTPEQKLRIVDEFRARDNVVAVTGDGVNDAPALRKADVGIAVVSGSGVAIEAADLVLLDNFDAIVDAIRVGRLVFQNLQKVIAYLLPAGSWSEIWPVLMNVFFGVPLPLSSFLMIIICVFTDLFRSLSLIMEKEELDLLSLPPRNHLKDHLINVKVYMQSYLFIGTMETVCAHSMFFLYMYWVAGIPFHSLVFAFEKYTDGFYGYTQDELIKFNNVGQCVYFVTLVMLQWGNILSVRNKRMSILQADPIRKKRRNPWLPVAMLVSLIIAIVVTEVPAFHYLFNTAPVPLELWFIPLPTALGILIMDEVRKPIVRSFPGGPIAKIAW
ncbi:sodium/potassium-transporting ATPase [Lipomyces kononenkoae]